MYIGGATDDCACGMTIARTATQSRITAISLRVKINPGKGSGVHVVKVSEEMPTYALNLDSTVFPSNPKLSIVTAGMLMRYNLGSALRGRRPGHKRQGPRELSVMIRMVAKRPGVSVPVIRCFTSASRAATYARRRNSSKSRFAGGTETQKYEKPW